MPALRDVLRDRRLRRLELAFVAFKAAESGTWVALLVYAHGFGGARATGLAALGQLVPAALLAPLAGALADRRGAGRVLALGYALQAGAAGATALALLTGQTPGVVLATAVVLSASLTCTRPAQYALTEALARDADQLTAANVLAGWIESIGMCLAPCAAGLLLTAGGPGLVYAAVAVPLAAAWISVTPLRRALPRGEGTGELRRAGAALRLVAVRRDERLLVALVAATFAAIGALDVMYVVLALDVLDLGGSGAGYLSAAFGAGGVLALAVTTRLVGRDVAPALGAATAAWAAALLVLGVAPGVAPALALLALAGVGRSVVDVGGRVLLQRLVEPRLLASVGGALECMSMAALGAGSLLAPALLAAGGSGLALAGTAALPVAVVLAGLPRLLTIDARTLTPRLPRRTPNASRTVSSLWP